MVEQPQQIQQQEVKEVKAAKRHPGLAWFFGILFAISFAVLLLTASLYVLTDEEVAVDTISYALATMYSRSGLDDTKEIQEVKSLIAKNGSFQPIPNLNIKMTLDEIEGLSPRDTRLAFFEKIAEPLYNGDLASLATNEGVKNQIQKQSQPIIKVASAQNHENYKKQLFRVGVVTLLFLAAYVFFSKQFGKIGNPGFVMVLDSALGTAVLWAILNTKQERTTALPIQGEEGNYFQMVGPLIHELAPKFAAPLYKIYSTALFVGLSFIAVAVLGKIIYGIIKKNRGVRSESTALPKAESKQKAVPAPKMETITQKKVVKQ